jgi:hypothetical protein
LAYLKRNKLNYKIQESEDANDEPDVDISSRCEPQPKSRKPAMSPGTHKSSPNRNALGLKKTSEFLGKRVAEDSDGMGHANLLSDEELVVLLRRPPKLVMEMKTKSTFQHFFKGIRSERMRSLLEAAYCEHEDDREREIKVEKRLALLKDFMT